MTDHRIEDLLAEIERLRIEVAILRTTEVAEIKRLKELHVSAATRAQYWQEDNKRLRAALKRLVFHDRAEAQREGLEGCIELQHSERILGEQQE